MPTDKPEESSTNQGNKKLILTEYLEKLAPSILKPEEAVYVDNKKLRELERKEKDTNKEFVKKNNNQIEEVRFYPDRPTQRSIKDKFIVKEPSKYFDPCQESSKMAIRCMENHDEDYKEVCGEYFRAYRECKKEWMEQRRKDNRSGTSMW
ncbi:hypothetical protein CAS74_003356 [Pichia kudriavzevii]|uniref:Cytochrome c oxidase-assembly factor COX23, mitochondrial n=1 Tax=Pichia kudriavzevii TaxID=4909 RepID=A0A099P1V1_PICKU|nr:uncharacterized protein C5L36_0B02560 [Pichia kudriavzevii]AWU74997.1 hypothetical protein C5L36_0B02560 [Pichia kudriavzevii]KGK38182.1 hypothetical protein JL09_g2679 [Pichia kudriavzevii]ONH74872.1 Cytochrome c oxidase-assembly factor COX23, mitochondrial [Pichia kudriavzevii]OUT21241.1 hypothetical protein CAS74_003356 [Pichia kudriavzevii]